MAQPLSRVARIASRALFVGITCLVAAACGADDNEIAVQVIELESSGQAGVATFVRRGDQTEVTLAMTPAAPQFDPQPVHIHYGSCGANLGRVHYALNDLVAGRSTTTVPARLEVLTDGNHAVNLHKSYPEPAVYNACGNIPTR